MNFPPDRVSDLGERKLWLPEDAWWTQRMKPGTAYYLLASLQLSQCLFQTLTSDAGGAQDTSCSGGRTVWRKPERDGSRHVKADHRVCWTQQTFLVNGRR